MLGKGLVRATTKEIARAAGLSEGTLYNHFANKEELFLCTLNELPSGFVSLIRGLQERAGTEAVQSVLEQIARSALDFYGEAIPMGASFFADPELLARHRELLPQRGAGPQRTKRSPPIFVPNRGLVVCVAMRTLMPWRTCCWAHCINTSTGGSF